jgi:hypothetical protein
MFRRKRLAALGASAAVVTLVTGAVITGVFGAGVASADRRTDWTSGPANPVVRGVALPNTLSPELREFVVAQGSNWLENPTDAVGFYGYDSNGTLVPDPAIVQSPGHNVEANKTEPDKNTYLRLHGLHGADPNYNYGTHFLSVPGPRSRHHGLRHPDQPRRRPGPPAFSAGAASTS